MSTRSGIGIVLLASIFAIGIHFGLSQHRKAATLSSIRRIHSALDAYVVDWCGYPWQVSLAGLRRSLSSIYLPEFPDHDAWGTPLRYSMIVSNSRYGCALRFALLSAGPDRRFELYGRYAHNAALSVRADDLGFISPPSTDPESHGLLDWWFPDDLLGDYRVMEESRANPLTILSLYRDGVCKQHFNPQASGPLPCAWDITWEPIPAWSVLITDVITNQALVSFRIDLGVGFIELKNDTLVLVCVQRPR